MDEMLGSLARWLRIMGYDAIYHKDQTDTEIVNTAVREGRYLLTRDRELALRAGELGIYVEGDEVLDQLTQVSRELGLASDETRTRCTLCNGELEKVPPVEVEDEVPEGALESNDEFYRCRSCGKIYWKGSHWEDIRSRLDQVENSK